MGMKNSRHERHSDEGDVKKTRMTYILYRSVHVPYFARQRICTTGLARAYWYLQSLGRDRREDCLAKVASDLPGGKELEHALGTFGLLATMYLLCRNETALPPVDGNGVTLLASRR